MRKKNKPNQFSESWPQLFKTIQAIKSWPSKTSIQFLKNFLTILQTRTCQPRLLKKFASRLEKAFWTRRRPVLPRSRQLFSKLSWSPFKDFLLQREISTSSRKLSVPRKREMYTVLSSSESMALENPLPWQRLLTSWSLRAIWESWSQVVIISDLEQSSSCRLMPLVLMFLFIRRGTKMIQQSLLKRLFKRQRTKIMM